MFTKHDLLSSREWADAPDDSMVMAYVRKLNSPCAVPRRFLPTSIHHRMADDAIILCDFPSSEKYSSDFFQKSQLEHSALFSEAGDNAPVFIFHEGCLREVDGVRIAHRYADGRYVFEMDNLRVSAECSDVTNKIILSVYSKKAEK